MGSITYILLLMFFTLSIFYFADAEKSLFHSSSNSRCIESEREALLEFKASLANASSTLSSSWTGLDCCSWYGITCHNLTGHVHVLNLTKNNFNSPMSPWLFNLTHLRVLSMHHSGLLGPIPNMFDKLTSLTSLDLSVNYFHSAFPDSLCRATTLTVMNLGATKFEGSLPFCIGNLTSLTQLELSVSQLSGELPGSLGNLTHLTHLYLTLNDFSSSIPSTLGNLKNLEVLCLDRNQFSGAIPSTLGNLTKLTGFYLEDNSLTGELSESVLGGLKSVKRLDVSRNYHLVLNVSPQWIPPFSIQFLQMDSIFIGTQFPPWLQTQTHLEILSMSNASLFGAISDQYVFPNLYRIDLSNNLFTGPVPILFSREMVSSTLILSGNQFSGNIPKKLCKRNLIILSMGYNLLMGTIPSCLGTLRGLFILDLGNNRLSGHIPNEFGLLSNLQILHLNRNKFFGEIPASLHNLTNLANVDFGENELHGSIPQWIGKKWSNLQYLRLESNNFFGEIPASLCQLPSLQILNLALNNLVGTIPSCIGNLSVMLSDKSGRVFSFNGYDDALLNINKGREMEYTSSLRYAKFISFSGNHLHGEIPTELMNLKGLQSLNLSNNELTGMIPETINNLKHMESLDLSMNRLFGTIPQSLTNIDALGYLNLSFNNLAGRIPSGNHFDTLNDPSIYEGNVGLCGKLLMKSCPGDDNSKISNQTYRRVSDGDDELSWLYAGIGPGVAVGFLGVMCILYFKDEWRIAYFGFADNVYNKVRIIFAIMISQSKFY